MGGLLGMTARMVQQWRMVSQLLACTRQLTYSGDVHDRHAPCHVHVHVAGFLDRLAFHKAMDLISIAQQGKEITRCAGFNSTPLPADPSLAASWITPCKRHDDMQLAAHAFVCEHVYL